MVTAFAMRGLVAAIRQVEPRLLGVAEGVPLLDRLTPQLRAGVTLTLVALVLLGVLLVLMIWVGGRYMRNVARQKPPERQRDPSDWDRKDPARSHERPTDELD